MVKIGNYRFYEKQTPEWQEFVKEYEVSYNYIGFVIYKKMGKFLIGSFIILLIASFLNAFLLLFESQELLFVIPFEVNRWIGIISGALFGTSLITIIGFALMDLLFIYPEVVKAGKGAGIKRYPDENDE